MPEDNKGLRIGVDATDIGAGMYKGGIYHYIINLFSTLREIDKSNKYIVFFNFFLNRHSAICREAIQLLEGKNIYIKLSRFPRTARRTFHIPVNFFIGNVDIFHGPFDNILPCTGCKRVVTVHDIRYFEIYPHIQTVLPEIAAYPEFNNYYNTWDNWMHSMMNRVSSAVKTADHIITVSNYTREALIKLFNVNTEKIHKVYNGLSPAFMPITNREGIDRIIDKYHIGRKDYFLFVGHMDPLKNILRMIDAYNELKCKYHTDTPHLIIITPTPGSDWFFNIVLRKIAELSLAGHVYFIHSIPDEDLPYFYSGAKALLIPSLYEGFGLPAIEAMACGTPVIASNVCSLPEVVGQDALLVDPYSISSISEAMDKMIFENRLRRDLIKRGLERSTMFSWERTARETLNVYRAVMC